MFTYYKRAKYLKNPAIRALLIGDSLVMTAAAMLTPIYAAFVAKMGGDIWEAGVTAAALAFGAGIASLVAGRYTDSLKNKKMIIVYGYLVIGVGFLLYTSVSNIWYLAIVQLLIGLVRPLYEPAFDALYSLHLDKHKEGEEWGAWEAMSYFTAAAGAALGGVIVAVFNFSTLFVVMAALCLMSATYVFRLPKKIL